MFSSVNRRKAVRLGILIIIAGTLATVAWALIFKQEGLNFYVVTPGVLYRSAQLDPEEMSEIIRRYKLKTIVNLRAAVKFAARGLNEETWVEDQGLRYLHLSSHTGTKIERLRRFLEVVINPESQPVLVHCHQGRGATGVFVAAYRICVEGWNAEDAADEMVKCGASQRYLEEHLSFLQRLAILQRSKHFFLQPPANELVAKNAPAAQASEH